MLEITDINFTLPVLTSIVNLKHLIDLSPELFLFVMLTLLLMYCAIHDKKNDFNFVVRSGQILFFIVFTTLVLLLEQLKDVNHEELFSGLLLIENCSLIIKMFVLHFALILMIMSKKYIEVNKIEHYEYTIVLGFSILGLLLLMSCVDFFSLYVSLELVSFTLFILSVLEKDSIYAAEAALKYFFTNGLATCLYLFGSVTIYLNVKSLKFKDFLLYLNKYDIGLEDTLNMFDRNFLSISLGLVLILLFFLFKIAAVPFHMWSPDVYEGAPMIVTAYFSIIIKFTMILLFIKTIIFNLADFLLFLQPLISFLACTSILIGSISACFQSKIKRLFAYSSISHMGYILMGIASASEEGLKASVFYTFAYVITNILIFSFLLSSNFNNKQQSPNNINIVYITDLRFNTKNNVFASSMFAIALLSFAGIPPLLGFFGKLYLFSAALNSQIYLTILCAIIGTSISCFYYLRVIKIMFFSIGLNEFDLKTIDNEKQGIMFLVYLFIISSVIYVTSIMTSLDSIITLLQRPF